MTLNANEAGLGIIDISIWELWDIIHSLLIAGHEYEKICNEECNAYYNPYNALADKINQKNSDYFDYTLAKEILTTQWRALQCPLTTHEELEYLITKQYALIDRLKELIAAKDDII